MTYIIYEVHNTDINFFQLLTSSNITQTEMKIMSQIFLFFYSKYCHIVTFTIINFLIVLCKNTHRSMIASEGGSSFNSSLIIKIIKKVSWIMCSMEKVGSIVNSISLRQVYRNTHTCVSSFVWRTQKNFFSLIILKSNISSRSWKTKNDILRCDFDLLLRYIPRSHMIRP